MGSQARIILNYGGKGSSKSYSSLQLYAKRFTEEDSKKILIVRKTLASARVSTIPVFKEILKSIGFEIDGSEGDVKCLANIDFYYGNSWVHFGGLDDPLKVFSTDWNYILMEEGIEFEYEDFTSLKLCLRAKSVDGIRNQMMINTNPMDAFSWIKVKLIDEGNEDLEIIHSTYLDNQFLDEEYIKDLENLKNINPNLYKILTLGEWGSLEDLIYSKWKSVPRGTFPDEKDCDWIVYGMDFGFKNPCALLEVRCQGYKLYVQQLLYESGLITKNLLDKMEKLCLNKNRELYADNADPQKIKELQQEGYNAIPCDKEIKVKFQIIYLKSFEIFVDDESENFKSEIRAYSHKKVRGVVTDDEVDFNNHLMKAMQYAVFTHSNNDRSDGILNFIKGQASNGNKSQSAEKPQSPKSFLQQYGTNIFNS